MRTKAAVVYEHNAPVVVEEVVLDDPRDHEVVVRMVATGVCHSDYSLMTGTIYYDPPVVMGHEGAGVIEKVGAEVTYVQPGDHVVLSFVTYCGECAMCQMEKPTLCTGYDAVRGAMLDGTFRFHNDRGQKLAQMARIGTMSELIVAPEQALVKIDPSYPLDKAALVGCAVPTGVGAVLNTAQVKPGSSVAVIGTGGVGLNAIQGAVLADARQIIAVDINDHKLEYATSFGATDVVNAAEVDPVAAVKALTGGLGVDYAFEVIGNPVTVKQAYDMTRPAGTAVIVGLTRPDASITVPTVELVRYEKRLLGCFYGSVVPRRDFPKYLQWYAEGKLKIDQLITAHYRLDQINEAFAAMEAGQNARGVILF